MNLRRPIILFAALGTVAVLAACGGSNTETKSATVPADAVAVVDGTPIAKKDFDRMVKLSLANFTQRQEQPPAVGTPEFEVVQQQAMQILFQRAVILSEAAKRHVKGDDTKLATTMSDFKRQTGDAAAWAKMLKVSGSTEADFVDVFRIAQLSQSITAQVVKEAGPVTEAEIEAQYSKDKDTVYKVLAGRKVVQILIGPADGQRAAPADMPKYKKTAEAAIAQLNRGTDFTTLVMQYSTDRRKKETEGVFNVPPTGIDPSFTKAAYALKTDAYTTAPVRSAFGYHVIKALADPTKDSVTPLSEVKDQVKAGLEDQRSNTTAGSWLDEVQATYAAKTVFATGYSLPPTVTATG